MNDKWLKGFPFIFHWPVNITTVLPQRDGALDIMMAHGGREDTWNP